MAGLKVWQTTIGMLGKAIHMSSGTVCLNGLLGIAEKGFKSPDRDAIQCCREIHFPLMFSVDIWPCLSFGVI